jgi:serine/threonine protein kinase
MALNVIFSSSKPSAVFGMQVKTIHDLVHNNVLRFHSWCAPAPFPITVHCAPATVISRICELAAIHLSDMCAWSTCRYETGNHLWLILEYCVGGDLKSLLTQDERLPESSVHDFGRDLLAALLFLHSRGIIHCDLKPSNIMMDEDGTIKLGGFSAARKLSHINSVPLAELHPVCFLT